MAEPIACSPVALDELCTFTFGFDALKTVITHVLQNQALHAQSIRKMKEAHFQLKETVVNDK